jgi:FG-GAP-like repeat
MFRYAHRLVAGVALAVALTVPSRAQLFTNGSAQIPQTGSLTEAVDLADIDGDGDWDAALADGGDTQQDQNRIWVNQGGFQGGSIGHFVDVTATQAPLVQDQSRDIEFADFDADGDPDVAISNEAQLLNQSCRFWCNLGGPQGGTAGFYANETSTRWVGLGGPGSSIPPSAVLAGGGFIDWTSDQDFADLDLDGDVDVFHSSHGGSFGGTTPSRVFLNDGLGFFSEFNPSQFQLTGTTIANGSPGLWCAGTQLHDTLDTSGQFCDIATQAIGVEAIDTDADHDVDLLLGERTGIPRLFRNRYTQLGFLGRYIDQTGADMPVAQLAGSAHYEQEFADMDGDGDVDLLGLGYQGFAEAVYPNDGAGHFSGALQLPSSNNDDQDAELCDFDGDGALDVYIAGFASTDGVYLGAPGAIAFTKLTPAQSGIAGSFRTLMGRAGDLDADGDYDVLTAQDAGNNEILWLNTQPGTNDDQAPYLPNVLAIGDRVATAAPVLALAHVYDNSSLRLVESNDTRVELSVDGCALPDLQAKVQATQVARAEFPGNLSGGVSWRYVSTDEHGNTGASAPQSFTSTATSVFAFGYGAGSPGSLGVPSVHALSVPFSGTTLFVAGKGAPASTLSWIALTTDPAPAAPLALPGLCNVNVLGNVIALSVGPTDAAGCAVAALPVPAGAPAGISVYAQFFALDGQAGNLLSSSAGLRIETQ